MSGEGGMFINQEGELTFTPRMDGLLEKRKKLLGQTIAIWDLETREVVSHSHHPVGRVNPVFEEEKRSPSQ